MKYRFASLLGGVIVLAFALCASAAVRAGNHPVRRVHSARRTQSVHRSAYHRTAHTRRRRSVRGTSRHAGGRHAARSRYSHHYRRTRYARSRRPRRPRLSIPPTRAEQIQQVLIKDGDLHSAPTGRWDNPTREAMKQYQTKNGFHATGLPDAKSLMKMGLGPHPLPPQLDPLAQVQPASPAPDSSPLPPQ